MTQPKLWAMVLMVSWCLIMELDNWTEFPQRLVQQRVLCHSTLPFDMHKVSLSSTLHFTSNVVSFMVVRIIKMQMHAIHKDLMHISHVSSELSTTVEYWILIYFKILKNITKIFQNDLIEYSGHIWHEWYNKRYFHCMQLSVLLAGCVGGGCKGSPRSLRCVYGWRSEARNRCSEGLGAGSKSCVHRPTSAVGSLLSGNTLYSFLHVFLILSIKTYSHFGIFSLKQRIYIFGIEFLFHFCSENNTV